MPPKMGDAGMLPIGQITHILGWKKRKNCNKHNQQHAENQQKSLEIKADHNLKLKPFTDYTKSCMKSARKEYIY